MILAAQNQPVVTLVQTFRRNFQTLQSPVAPPAFNLDFQRFTVEFESIEFGTFHSQQTVCFRKFFHVDMVRQFQIQHFFRTRLFPEPRLHHRSAARFFAEQFPQIVIQCKNEFIFAGFPVFHFPVRMIQHQYIRFLQRV